MTKLLGVEFAPLMIPRERRLQTLAAIHYVFVFLILPVLSVYFFYYLFVYTQYWWICLLYLAWVYYDYDTPKKGSWRVFWFRNMSVWRYTRDYFPIKLHRTVELDPTRNYLLGYHPHGIASIGAFVNFCTEATGFTDLFPGLEAHLLTLVGQFYFPFRREYIMATGACDCSKESMKYLLTLSPKPKGHAVVLVVGGAEEALDARPGMFHLQMQRRFGFIKVAIKTGADLVPIYSFGENDLFDQIDNPDGSFVRSLQTQLKRILGFAPAAFRGRGVFNYTFGLLPYRRPINTVVGKPICVGEAMEFPTEEKIKEIHQGWT